MPITCQSYMPIARRYGLRTVCARFADGLRTVCARFAHGLRTVCARFAHGHSPALAVSKNIFCDNSAVGGVQMNPMDLSGTRRFFSQKCIFGPTVAWGVAWDICARFAHGLRTVCARLAHGLRTACARLADGYIHRLCIYILRLHSVCTPFALRVSSVCTPFALRLHSVCKALFGRLNRALGCFEHVFGKFDTRRSRLRGRS